MAVLQTGYNGQSVSNSMLVQGAHIQIGVAGNMAGSVMHVETSPDDVNFTRLPGSIIRAPGDYDYILTDDSDMYVRVTTDVPAPATLVDLTIDTPEDNTTFLFEEIETGDHFRGKKIYRTTFDITGLTSGDVIMTGVDKVLSVKGYGVEDVTGNVVPATDAVGNSALSVVVSNNDMEVTFGFGFETFPGETAIDIVLQVEYTKVAT